MLSIQVEGRILFKKKIPFNTLFESLTRVNGKMVLFERNVNRFLIFLNNSIKDFKMVIYLHSREASRCCCNLTRVMCIIFYIEKRILYWEDLVLIHWIMMLLMGCWWWFQYDKQKEQNAHHLFESMYLWNIAAALNDYRHRRELLPQM